MASYLDIKMLADLVRTKRGRRGLRKIESITGVSASTLSRIENGAVPDMDTFFAVCDWLEIPPYEFIKLAEDKGKKDDYALIFCTKLRTDSRIPAPVTDALALLIEALFGSEP